MSWKDLEDMGAARDAWLSRGGPKTTDLVGEAFSAGYWAGIVRAASAPVAQSDGEPASRPPLHRECAMFPPEERCGGCGPLSPAAHAPVAQPLTKDQKHALCNEWGEKSGTRTLFELIEMVERAHDIKATGQDGGAE